MTLDRQLTKLVSRKLCTADQAVTILQRIKEGALTMDENPETHFCVYFAAIDPNVKEVFVGHHKRSGLWLVNGGHIDKGETLEQTLQREIDEEWGLTLKPKAISKPFLISITQVQKNTGRPCKIHYDIWHTVTVDKTTFHPIQKKLNEEFYETQWCNLTEARNRITQLNTLEALDLLEKRFR